MARKKHYLISLNLTMDLHMHCYLMCMDERYAHAIPEKMIEEAEKRGFRPLPIILSTVLSDSESVALVRKILSEDENAKRHLETATDHHCTIFCMNAPHDDALMELH